MKTHLFAPVIRILSRLLTVAVLVLIHFGSCSAYAQRMPQDSWYLAKQFRGDIEGGSFRNPHAIALGPDGNLYITDRYNHRVQVFDQNGNFVRKWGGYGSAYGQLNDPTGIAVKSDGTVYVCEWGNNRVQVFDSQGNFIRVIGQSGNNQTGSGKGQFCNPHGIVLDSVGNLYVNDYNNHRIEVFNPDGTYKTQWGGPGGESGSFNGGPVSICYNPVSQQIAVSEDGGACRTQVFDTKGNYLFRMGADNFGLLTYGATVDESGNYYIAAANRNGVWKFDSQGNQLGGWSQSPVYPFGIAYAGGKFFICEYNWCYISIYQQDGTRIADFGRNGIADFSTPYGMAIASNGNIYISDSGKNQIRIYDKNLNFVTRFGSGGSGNGQFSTPFTMAIGTNNQLYVVDRGNNRVQIFDIQGNYIGQFGQPGLGKGQFNNPWGIAIGANGNVHVVDQSNHRVEVFDPTGKFLFTYGSYGNLDAQFNNPQDIVALPNGNFVVGDRGNGRIKILDSDGKYLNQSGWNPDRICCANDGNLYGNLVSEGPWWNHWVNSRLSYFDTSSLTILKDYLFTGDQSGPCIELPNGDVLNATYNGLLCILKRTYRLQVPVNGHALPYPSIVKQSRRPGTTLVDIDYVVKDSDSTNVATGILAFKDGGNDLGSIIPMKTFVEGTAAMLGSNFPVGVTNRVTWNAGQDWATNFGNIQFQVMAKDSRQLLNVDFINIPAVTNAVATNAPLTISRCPLNDADFLQAWYWLVASGDSSIKLSGSVVIQNSSFSFTAPTNVTQGLWVTRYSNPDWTGNSQSKVETSINFGSWSDWNDLNNAGAASIYVGMITPPTTGTYQFFIEADDVVNWFINGQYGQQDGGRPTTITLQAGVPVPLVINYNDFGGVRRMKVRWLAPGQTDWASVPDNVYSTSVLQQASANYGDNSPLASGSYTTPSGRAFLFARQGYREATPAEIAYARSAGMTNGTVNQWAPPLKVGPDERPAAINSWGFDTAGSGCWVVPITVTNSSATNGSTN